MSLECSMAWATGTLSAAVMAPANTLIGVTSLSERRLRLQQPPYYALSL